MLSASNFTSFACTCDTNNERTVDLIVGRVSSAFNLRVDFLRKLHAGGLSFRFSAFITIDILQRFLPAVGLETLAMPLSQFLIRLLLL